LVVPIAIGIVVVVVPVLEVAPITIGMLLLYNFYCKNHYQIFKLSNFQITKLLNPFFDLVIVTVVGAAGNQFGNEAGKE